MLPTQKIKEADALGNALTVIGLLEGNGPTDESIPDGAAELQLIPQAEHQQTLFQQVLSTLSLAVV